MKHIQFQFKLSKFNILYSPLLVSNAKDSHLYDEYIWFERNLIDARIANTVVVQDW